MVRLGLFVRLKAKTGREMDVENFLREALEIVDGEDGTLVWFALRLAPDTFAIFDAFPDEEARQAHLSGRVASALTEKAPELLAEPPTIERADILAGMLPGVPVTIAQTAGGDGDS
jgi:quinol monooxygenase YgiN